MISKKKEGPSHHKSIDWRLLFESIMSSDAGTRKRSRREVTSRKPGDDDRWNAAQTSVASVKNVIIDERRNVMRNLPDPKLFPGDEKTYKRRVCRWTNCSFSSSYVIIVPLFPLSFLFECLYICIYYLDVWLCRTSYLVNYQISEINSLMKSEVKKDLREMERDMLFTKNKSTRFDFFLNTLCPASHIYSLLKTCCFCYP
jgi:hypothetical protein